jgi:hypothetical protein
VHLNNKYVKGGNEIPALKEILEYSTGGIYGALDNSGYFERKADGIQLTQKGQEYLKKEILTPLSISDSVATILIVIGFVFLLQWIDWTYANQPLILPWYTALLIIGSGLFIRFFILRVNYWIIKRRKKMI